MAGAEVITLVGLAAAVGQLIDYSTKFPSMLRDGRDAPGNATRLLDEARRVHSLACDIKARYPCCNTMGPFLETCITESEGLIQIANGFIAHSNLYGFPTGFYRKINFMFVWRKRYEQIKQHLERIERNKSCISLCIQLRGLSVEETKRQVDPMTKVLTAVMQSEMHQQSSKGSYSTLPECRHRLLGYDRAMFKLRTVLSRRETHTRVILTGLSGIGKSHLALAYGQNLKSSNPDTSVFWICASQEQTLVGSYMKIAEIAGLSLSSSKQETLIRDVLGFLESLGKAVLLIYDDLGNSHDWGTRLEDYLPKGRLCHAIFTVRDPKYGSFLNFQDSIINLQGLEPDAAQELLLDHLGSKGKITQDSAELVSTLGYIPLAILQAASFMTSTRTTIRSYLNLLLNGSEHTERMFQEHMIHEFDTSNSKSFFEALTISLQSVKQQDSPAFNIISIMSCVHNTKIPLFILANGIDDANSSKSLKLLRDLSLIDSDDGLCSSYGISPIVQLLIRDHLKSVDQYKDSLALALEKVLDGFPVTFREHKDFMAGSAYLSHAEELFNQEKGFTTDHHGDLADLAARATTYLLEQGLLTMADGYAQKAIRFSELAFGPDDRKTMKAQSVIAIILRRRGKLMEAEETTRQLLDRRTILLGNEDFDTLASMNNLAIILQAQGLHEDAEIWYRKTVELHESMPGPETVEMIQTLENLALTLQDQKKYPEANALYQRVLSWRTEHFGASDSRTIGAKSNFGTLMQREKKWEEAWELHSEVFNSHTRKFGRMHPQTMKSQANLAIIMHMQGYLKPAEPFMRQAAENLRTVLGPTNQDTLRAMRNLAGLLRDLQEYEEAEEVSWNTWRRSSERFGPQSPDALASKRQLDQIRRMQCKADLDGVD